MRPKVVVVGPVFPYRGAISYCTTELGKELTAEFDVDYLSFSRQYPKRLYPGESDVDETVRHLAPPRTRYALDILNPLTWLREGLRLRHLRPDAIVLCWWAWVWAPGYLVLLRALGRRAPVVVQCHNVSDKEGAWWKTLMTNALFRRADALVVHSQTGADELAERLGEEVRARTTKLFLPVLKIGREIPPRDEAKRQLGLEGRNVALFFGHIRPFKGLDIAFEAWKHLTEEVTLLVAGEVWWKSEEEVRGLAESLGIADRVRFRFGFIPDSDVSAYFAAADVVVAPYRHEAQSGVAMNAFHFGRPVIASRVGGIPEAVHDGENGLLVPPEDPRALASAIDRFFRDCDRPQLERGAEASGRQFSWDRYGTGVAGALRGVMKAR